MIIIQCGEGHISILRRGPYVGEHGCTKSPMLFFVDLPSTPVPDAPSSILPGWNQTLNSYQEVSALVPHAPQVLPSVFCSASMPLVLPLIRSTVCHWQTNVT